MRKLNILFLLSFICTTVNAASIDIDSGIEVLITNGVEVTLNKIEPELRNGENQLVVKIDARLRSGGKTEYLTSNPYIVTFNYDPDLNLSITLKAKSEEQAKKYIANHESFININQNTQDVVTSWAKLPADGSFLPYAKPLENLLAYNSENGLIYEGSQIRSLKAELEKVESGDVVIAEKETETTLQLKLWYTRASEVERQAFQKWVLTQD